MMSSFEKKPLRSGNPEIENIRSRSTTLFQEGACRDRPFDAYLVRRANRGLLHHCKGRACFEKRVVEKVKETAGERTSRQTGEHITELGYSRPRQSALDIELCHGDRGSHKRREGSDETDELKPVVFDLTLGNNLPDWISASNQIYPAATIVAASINAEIGVGPSIASGSPTCSGNSATGRALQI